MISSLLLAAAQTSARAGNSWGVPEALIMSISCLVILLLASRGIERPHDGRQMPLPFPEVFNNISVGGFLGAMSFGHVVGSLLILTLADYIG
ncbi:MAG: photosystem I reaction center subunit PsaK [Leptolyngbyaceae cyanobacterium RM2_2_4]|nr:photosystem I reaction center subunit PsaK [Leptolyngbyaceae cyanobacterium SM1_4_3]NJN91571.1 photosystem I reaction center subunit PsaK [Leptolyngbyaceae cyanobacterium SL_5_14]NJO52382.1 photosystem I reaction center subunit PsaK [Leptolyngbyaceae cyanobacterium RM2_2_4]